VNAVAQLAAASEFSGFFASAAFRALKRVAACPLRGLFLGDMMLNLIVSAAGNDATQPKSFGSFPSGHLMMTLFTAVVASRLLLRRYCLVTSIATGMMGVAVLYLRYHYLADIAGTVPCIGLGLWVGCLEHNVVEKEGDSIGEGTKGLPLMLMDVFKTAGGYERVRPGEAADEETHDSELDHFEGQKR